MSQNSIIFGPLSQSQVADYAEASGDFNKIHLDTNFAQAAGLPGTIVHGMLTMGLVGEALNKFGIESAHIVEFETKFKDIVPVNSRIVVHVESLSEDRRRIALKATAEDGREICHSSITLKEPLSAKSAL